MRNTSKLSYLLIVFVLFLSACNMPNAGVTTPTDNPGAVQTAAAQTVQALQTQIAGTQPATQVMPTQSPSSTPQPSTAVVAPTNTTSAPIFIPSSTSAPVQTTPCDRGGFDADVTIPDGTNFQPGATFTKTWRIRNTGTCTWTTGYKLVFVSGASMGGPATQALPSSVAPNQTVDISVALTAPTTPGKHRGDWQLENASGQRFGLGTSAKSSFWVEINVGGTVTVTGMPSYFAVTSVKTVVDPGSGSCPRQVKITADITASKAGTVTYYWIRSDGAQDSAKDLEFTAAGTKTVSTTWELGSPSEEVDEWIQVYIDNPNHQAFAQTAIKFTCSE